VLQSTWKGTVVILISIFLAFAGLSLLDVLLVKLKFIDRSEKPGFLVFAACLCSVVVWSVLIPICQHDQQQVVEKNGRLVQILKLVDANEDPALSAGVRDFLAQQINDANDAIAEAKARNPGLLDIWYSDVLAASEPLK
jgi:hypothetical protein